MNHLGVVFSDAFGLFWGFGLISRKMDEISKSGQFQGSTQRRRDPMQRRGREGGLDKPRVQRGVANLHHGEGLRGCVAVLRSGVATVHSMENF